MNTKNEYKKGQVLLLLIMLIATVITVVVTITFRARTESQLSKIEQEAQKSLGAAEAAIEASIRTGTVGTRTFSDLGINLNGIDMTNSNVQITTESRSEFVSPLIAKDDIYTYYLANYADGVFTPNGSQCDLSLFYGSEGACNQLALEFSMIHHDPNVAPAYATTREKADVGQLLSASAGVGQAVPNTIIGGFTFRCLATITVPVSARLLMVHVVGNNTATRIGTNTPTLPPQGKYIYSEAKTTTGVVKKVQLFQSFPQIPRDMFITSFNQQTLGATVD